jgi:hypothetical protein
VRRWIVPGPILAAACSENETEENSYASPHRQAGPHGLELYQSGGGRQPGTTLKCSMPLGIDFLEKWRFMTLVNTRELRRIYQIRGFRPNFRMDYPEGEFNRLCDRTHTMPWAQMALSIGLSSILFLAALELARTREY